MILPNVIEHIKSINNKKAFLLYFYQIILIFLLKIKDENVFRIQK